MACGSSVGIHKHHIDWHHDNNDISNLTVRCHHCHEQEHKLGKDGFEDVIRVITSNPTLKREMQKTSVDRHRELHGPAEPNIRQLGLFD